MNPETYIDPNNWSGILPEISLVVLALAILVVDMFRSGSGVSKLSGRLAVIGQVVLLAVLTIFWCGNLGLMDTENFAGMLYHSEFGQIMRVFFIVCSILTCYVGSVFLEKNKLPGTEFYTIILLVTSGFMLLAQSNHFVQFFISLELVTVGFYVLVSYNRNRSHSLEAGLKYLILGGMSTAILLFGIVLLYGVASTPGLPGVGAEGYQALNFSDLREFLALNSDNLVARIGVLLVIAGVAFKIGTVPFQIWIPDVYQGAPTPVTAFLAVASKAGGFAVLMVLVSGPFAPMKELLVPVLSVIAMVTILFGNLTACVQRNVKRLMGLSGISHAGYLLIGVVAMFTLPSAQNAIIFYLITYLLGSFAVFGVMAHLAPVIKDEAQNMESYEDLLKERPFLGAILVMGLGSLAGIPPLAGFIGKLLLFIAAFKAGLYGLLGVAIVGVVISIYYYFGWIREATFRFWKLPPLEGEPEEEAKEWPEVSLISKLTLGGLALLTLVIGLYQGPLSALIGS